MNEMHFSAFQRTSTSVPGLCRRIAILCGIGLAAIAAAGCSDSGDDDAGSLAGVAVWEEHSCRIPIPEGLAATDFRCGALTVPADWDAPNGSMISFEVAVLISSGGAPDPLVFFGGGPGVWNLQSYLQAQSTTALAPIANERDIVFFDQRGNGLSEPGLSCPEVDERTLEAYSQIIDARGDAEAFLAGYRQCHARLTGAGIDLSVFNSYQLARDVSALMDALGYTDYNVYGISYGGRQAQVLVRERPDGIRSLILDSTTMPEISFGAAWAPNFERSLDVLFDQCAASAACSGANPDLRQSMITAVDLYNETAHYSPTVLEDGTPQDVYVTGDRFAGGLQTALYRAEFYSVLPTVISTAAAGVTTLIDAFVPNLVATGGIDRGLYASMLCAEEIPFDTEESLRAPLAELTSQFAQPLFEINGGYFIEMCDIWQVPARPAVETEPVVSDIPALVLSGEFDPATPPAYGEKAAANLLNSQYFLFRGIGHGVLRSEVAEDGVTCSQQIMLDFLDDPQATVDGSCTEALTGPFE